MLNSETKRHIDAARDVLVGVAPNPTTQIDQITYALIYKFMDDMDQAAVKAGGEPTFFTGELNKYAWSKLVSTTMGNQEKMNLYGEALTKFSEAKQLPELFRTIFRAAFLPYRSPETLGLFLKEISYFDYSHSEELGNAYEYLLSIMSSQGDAGQFRTPRHIIDFMVDVVNPTKDDKVLDPACGTGGFLVSSYNHILEQHDGKDDPKRTEKTLTPDQRKKLMQNFEGYDIDPTMGRIAQVNMYLHLFKNPKIFQYDTLTSEERWNDRFDVILANPPFMTPKGGIKPHNKFGIQANRSEVLFVDYISSHLRPKGRAGIIVPEGIIFQSGKAYKELRKNLVGNGLYAVVSLPSGVFQPYSGVKTSILFLNGEIAKNQSEILFVKIGADGFDLGATKRVVERNDLPEALNAIHEWENGRKVESALVSFVSKEAIATNGDYNLSGDRYKVNEEFSNSSWPVVELGDVSKLFTGGTPASSNPMYYGGNIKWLVSGDIHKGQVYECAGRITELALSESNAKMLPINSVLIALNGQGRTRGTVAILRTAATCNQSLVAIEPDTSKVTPEFLYYVLKGLYQEIRNINGDDQRAGLNMPLIRKIRIPLPSLEVQEQIVAELDGYSAIISGAKQIVENWKPRIEVDPEWPLIDIGSTGDFVRGPFGGSLKKEIFVASGYAIYEQQHAIGDQFTSFRYFIGLEKFDEMRRFSVSPGEIIMSCSGTFGKVAIVPEGAPEGVINQALLKIRVNGSVDAKYLKYVMESPLVQNVIAGKSQGTSLKNVPSVDEIKAIKIPLPTIEVQQRLVSEIELEIGYIASARSLVEIYENRSQAAIAKLWSE